MSHDSSETSNSEDAVFSAPSHELKPGEDYVIPWTRNEEVDRCMVCDTPFSLFLRRHHCRSCGDVVCAPCAESKREVFGLVGLHRVCDPCLANGVWVDPVIQRRRRDRLDDDVVETHSFHSEDLKEMRAASATASQVDSDPDMDESEDDLAELDLNNSRSTARTENSCGACSVRATTWRSHQCSKDDDNGGSNFDDDAASAGPEECAVDQDDVEHQPTTTHTSTTPPATVMEPAVEPHIERTEDDSDERRCSPESEPEALDVSKDTSAATQEVHEPEEQRAAVPVEPSPSTLVKNTPVDLVSKPSPSTNSNLSWVCAIALGMSFMVRKKHPSVTALHMTAVAALLVPKCRALLVNFWRRRPAVAPLPRQLVP
ncbi:hypothetical protein Ae201684P_001569 [Aphanomyces euteiches]|nr:hypothetical protein Ae201684P_001569 [Aphanomyces euteiches]